MGPSFPLLSAIWQYALLALLISFAYDRHKDSLRNQYYTLEFQRKGPRLMTKKECLVDKNLDLLRKKSCGNIEDVRTVGERGFVLFRNLVPINQTRKIRKVVENFRPNDRYRCGCNTAIEPVICRPSDRWFYDEIPDTMRILEATMRRIQSQTTANYRYSKLGKKFSIQSGEFSGINPWPYPFQYINEISEYMDSMKSQELRVLLTKYTGLPMHQGRHGWHQDGGPIHKFFLVVRKEDPEHANLKMMPWDAYRFCQPTESAEYRSNGGWQGESGYYYFDIEKITCMPHLEVGDVVFFREDVYHDTQDVIKDRMALIFNVVTA
mmetsp:Transcript_24129/g.33455  ORF Transcript_24129/g.33455 Transcript_24129/m.33455 type:complete len:322 (+) Transcript_24129:63-1028(+)